MGSINENYELHSSLHLPNTQNDLEANNQKKKSRGNRKLQRYRRKLRKQNMNTEVIADLLNSQVITNQSTTDIVIQPNEQSLMTTTNTIISHPPKPIKKMNKKNFNKKSTIIKNNRNSANQTVPVRKVKAPVLIKDSFDYTSVPNEIFSQMLSTAFNGIDTLNLFSNDDDDEKIKFIRHYTSLIDRLSYVKLQELQWQYYHDIGMTKNIWKGGLAKHFAETYSISYTYGRGKTIVEQRLRQIQQHLPRAHHAIQQFEEEILSKSTQHENCAFAIRQLFSIVHQFVQEKQWPLQHEFEYKREMLVLDATDHQLLQNFLDIEPNKTHIIIAKRIWQATMKQMMIEEEIALLEHRLTSTLSQSKSNSIGRMIDDIDNILENSSATVATSSATTYFLPNEINRLQILKRDIIHQAIISNRRQLEDLNTMIQIEQNKFYVKNRYMESTSEWQKMVFDTIEARRLHMIERANFIIKHKQATSFNIRNDLHNNQTTSDDFVVDICGTNYISFSTTNTV